MRRGGSLYLVLLIALAAGCATSGTSADVQHAAKPAQPAKVMLLAGSDAAVAVARALKQHDYLQLTIKDQGVLLRERARGAVDPRPAAQKRAREALEQARADYRTFKFTEVVTRLSQAQNHLTAVAMSSDDFKLLAQLALQRGLSQLALKIPDEAEQAFATAYLLGYQGPAAGDHPPEIEAAIKRAGEQLASATKGGLTIKVRPDNARVFVDGKQRGAAPVTVQVRPGLHHVRVSCTGQTPKAFFHRVSAGRMERLEIFLKPAPPDLAARQLLQAIKDGEPLKRLDRQALVKTLGERSVLLAVATSGGAMRPEIVAPGAATPAPDASRCGAPTPDRVARCLGPLVYQLATGRPHQPGTGSRSAAAPTKPVYKRWWFWALVAGGVAGAAGATAGIYYGTQPRGTNIDVQLN